MILERHMDRSLLSWYDHVEHKASYLVIHGRNFALVTYQGLPSFVMKLLCQD